MLKKLEELSNGLMSKFKLTTHVVNITKKKDVASEDIPEMTRTVSETGRRQPGPYCSTNLSNGQISIPVTREDHYAILDFSHNSKKYKHIEKCKI